MLMSAELLLDPDECVVALMAKHLQQGKDYSLFFWNQTYGLTIVESCLIAFFYGIGGVTDYMVKLAMLTIWTGGVVFFYKALKSIDDKTWLPLLLTLVLICSPSWAAWSMKARGGYITAFCFTSICYYLIFKEKRSAAVHIAIGLLMALVFQAQMLWVIFIVPLYLYIAIVRKESKKILYATVVLLITTIALYI